MPQPVIARVQGLATAAGCQLVATLRPRGGSEDARFAVSGVNLGLFCSTPSVALSRNLLRKQAFEMLVTGRIHRRAPGDRMGPGQSGHAGRAASMPRCDLLARAILAKPEVAVRMGKDLFYRQLEMGTAAAYQLAGQTMACNMMDESALAGVQAFLDKRSGSRR